MVAAKRRGEVELTLPGGPVVFLANIDALERIQDSGPSIYDLPIRFMEKTADIAEVRAVIDATTEMGFEEFNERYGLKLATDCALIVISAGLGIDEEDGVKSTGKKSKMASIFGGLFGSVRRWAGDLAMFARKA